jgi:hypothetical protein
MPAMPVKLLILTLCFLSTCFSSAGAQASPNQGSGTILGTVVDPMGMGIPGVRITVVENSYKRIFDGTTDCSGFFRLSDLPTGSYTVRFGKQAFRVETRTSVLISPYAVTQLDTKMQPGQFTDWGPTIETHSGPSHEGSITGTVKDIPGAPIPGARVKAIEEKTGYAAETTTNANGLYRFSGIERGTYSVTVEAQGFKTENKRSVLAGSGASVDIRLSVGEYSGPIVTPEPVAEEDSRRTGTGPAGTIQGTVIDATGAVPARISAVDEATGKHFETTTDSNGAYHFRNLPAGIYCARFEAWAAQWKAHPEEVRPTFQTSKEVRVEPSRVSELNVSLPAPRTVIVEVCASSCVIQTGGVRASHPKIALQLYASSNVVRAGNQLWITTTLTNISRHAVFIRAQSGRTATVDYQIYADGKCGCPGPLRKRDTDFVTQSERLAWLSQWRKMRVRSGKTLIDRVDLSNLLDLRRPGVHAVAVEYAEDLIAADGKEIKHPPMTVSNSITVVVTADSP